MSKENIWVLGFPAVPLMGMILSRRRAAAGSLVSSDWAQATPPRNNRPAAIVAATAQANDRHFSVAVHREPLLARIPSSHALVSDADSRSHHPVGTIAFSVGTSTPRRPKNATEERVSPARRPATVPAQLIRTARVRTLFHRSSYRLGLTFCPHAQTRLR